MIELPGVAYTPFARCQGTDIDGSRARPGALNPGVARVTHCSSVQERFQ